MRKDGSSVCDIQRMAVLQRKSMSVASFMHQTKQIPEHKKSALHYNADTRVTVGRVEIVHDVLYHQNTLQKNISIQQVLCIMSYV